LERRVHDLGTPVVTGRHHFPVMGTVFSFAWRQQPSEATVRAVEHELVRIDRMFSTYRSDSQVSLLAAGRLTWGECAPEIHEVLDLCARAQRLTAGYFSTTPRGRLDPTGLVKGWAVRRAALLLSEAGSTSHVVNGGGDVLVNADPAYDVPWRVGVSGGGRDVVAVVEAHRMAIATSGNVERPGEIVDPHTARPAVALRSVSVIGLDIVTADACATAAVAMGASALGWLDALPGHEGVVVSLDGQVSATRGAQAWVVDHAGAGLMRAGRARTAAT
jgi:thiamine biosynthesis lipoprotein